MQPDTTKSERRLPALAISRGIGIGQVAFLHGDRRQFFRVDLDEEQVGAECARLRVAIVESARQLRGLATSDGSDHFPDISDIFNVQLLMLEESSLVGKIENFITDNKVNAEWALKIVAEEYIQRQLSVADGRFREKSLDIEDVADRLMSFLAGSKAWTAYPGAVVVARELRPSAVMELAKSNPAALVTERGGWTSHASIIAREFKLPMAAGVKNLTQILRHGDHVIVDGIQGQIVVNPDISTVEYFLGISQANRTNGISTTAFEKALVTLDGTEIAICANVDIPEGYLQARRLGARGIGLFRSESLIGNLAAIPSEDEQALAYRRMADAVGGDRVKIRTFDIGPNQFEDDAPLERNPSLGLRSIRLSLSETESFRTQIRAILRAAAAGGIDIVFPMISGVSEIERSRTILDEEREKLERAGVHIGSPQIGAMIELPSAVLTAREIARHVDFLCLGTNDLVQYLLAVDRDNDSVADWYQSLHPAVIRAIIEVVTAAEAADKPIAVCGEIAGSPFYVPVLIGLGVRELSMNVNSISQVRRLVSGVTLGETIALAESIKGCETSHQTEHILREFYRENWSSLFPANLLNEKHR